MSHSPYLLQILEEIGTVKNEQIVKVVPDLGDDMQVLRNFSQTHRYYMKAIGIRRAMCGEWACDEDVFELLVSLGNIEGELMNEGNARHSLLQALEM